MNYSEKLKEARAEHNMQQKDVAKILGISISTYSDYENQISVIPIKHLISLSEYYKLSIDYLLDLSHNYYYEDMHSFDIMVAGRRLKDWRRSLKIKQQQLAEELNTTQPVIANYERGRTIISTPFLYDICKKYKVSADYLLGKIDSPKSFK